MRFLPLYLLFIGCFLITDRPAVAALGVPLKTAEDARSAPRLQASLSSDHQTIASGQTFYVLLTQDIAPGWHTYWRNPGDSGAPAKLHWDLPAGFTAAEIEWPYPEPITYGPLMNFGFSKQLVLLIKMTAPDILTAESVTLRAKGQWLVCADVCIPESADLNLSLAVGASQPDADGVYKLMQARQNHPLDAGIAVRYQVQGQTLRLQVMLGELAPERITEVRYFPYNNGVIEHGHPQQIDYFAAGLILSTKVGYDYSSASVFDGIMVLREDVGGHLATAIIVQPEPAQPEGIFAAGDQVKAGTIITAMLLAILGGLILNLMPCVFPVLSIKILSLIGHTANLRGHGLVYTLGVVLSFLVIAGILIGLRQGGAEIGWGFHLQSPLLVSLLVYLFLLIGLNLSGFFEVGTRLMGASIGQGAYSGYLGSFSTGILATLVAAPCSAPFMAAAVGFALTQDTVDALLIFSSLGFGMALPYLLLCYWPSLLNKLPAPGSWMIKVKEFLAFPMYASAIWLLWVVSIQSGSQGVLGVTAGMLLLVFSIWLLDSLPRMHLGKYCMRLLALGLIIIAIILPSQMIVQQTDTNKAARFLGSLFTAPSSLLTRVQQIDHKPYSEARLAALRQVGPVFVNFTAAWCITCKVNEAVVLNSATVQQAFAEYRVAYLKADWTNQDPAITRKLAEYQRSGVPLYLLYDGLGGPAEVLPQILSADIIRQALTRLSHLQI